MRTDQCNDQHLTTLYTCSTLSFASNTGCSLLLRARGLALCCSLCRLSVGCSCSLLLVLGSLVLLLGSPKIINIVRIFLGKESRS